MGDETGRCATLLQCFVSYTYRGLASSTLDNYLPEAEMAMGGVVNNYCWHLLPSFEAPTKGRSTD